MFLYFVESLSAMVGGSVAIRNSTEEIVMEVVITIHKLLVPTSKISGFVTVTVYFSAA
jgi:hypothetical protein